MDDLGEIIVVSLSTSISLPLKELKDRTKNNSVLSSFVPKCMGIGAAFRKATDSACKGLPSTIHVDEVPYEKSPDNCIVRHFSSMVYSGDGGKIKKVVTLVLDKESGTIYDEVYENGHIEMGKHISQQVHNNFGFLYSNTLTIKEVREYITRTLLFCNCVKLRQNGGVYFVPKPLCSEVTNLITSLKNIDGVDFTRITVSNTENNRKAIAKLVLNSVDETLKEEIARLERKRYGVEIISFLPFDEFKRALFRTNIGTVVMSKMLRRIEHLVLKVRIYSTLLKDVLGDKILSNVESIKEELEETIEEREMYE